MTNRREGREGREREGERDRERGSRAKPRIILSFWRFSDCLRFILKMASASRMRYTASEVKHMLQYYDNYLKDSDASEIVIEVLCKYVCSRLPFVYDSFDAYRGV